MKKSSQKKIGGEYIIYPAVQAAFIFCVYAYAYTGHRTELLPYTLKKSGLLVPLA